MKALLTGGGGFCGRHLRRHLETLDVTVGSMGRDGDGPHATRLGGPTDGPGMQAALAEFRPDYVLHLAGLTSAASARDLYAVNVLFAVHLIEAMDAAGCSDVPLLLVGTAAEYGPIVPGDLPLAETHPPAPVTRYGITKLAQTLEGLAAARRGRPIVIARPFNIIGPGMPEHLVVGSIVRQIRSLTPTGTPARLELGNTTPTRDFIDVADVVACYWGLVRSPDAYGGITNVCTGREVAIGDVARRLVALSGVEIEIEETDDRRRADEIPRHCGDNGRLFEVIGRRPEIPLETTLASIMEHTATST